MPHPLHAPAREELVKALKAAGEPVWVDELYETVKKAIPGLPRKVFGAALRSSFQVGSHTYRTDLERDVERPAEYVPNEAPSNPPDQEMMNRTDVNALAKEEFIEAIDHKMSELFSDPVNGITALDEQQVFLHQRNRVARLFNKPDVRLNHYRTQREE
jgi:hypothetical protein